MDRTERFYKIEELLRQSKAAHSFDAYSVLFDDHALSVGQSVQPTQGVTLTRRC